MKTITAALSAIGFYFGLSRAAMVAQPAPPGVPEPGLVVWGTVVNSQNPTQAMALISASWTVTDGVKVVVLDGTTKPAVRIVNHGGQSYYILEVPFDTRNFGSISLSDPSATGAPSFELKGTSPSPFTLTPTINGALASVRAIDGVSASGTNLPVNGFTAAVRGRAIRADLSISPPTDPYETWAIQNFGSAADARAGRGLDPDGDGFNNEAEFLAGTGPLNASSALRILGLSFSQSQLDINLLWMSVTNRRYRIESSVRPNGPYTEIGSIVPSSGNTTQGQVPRNSSEAERFYRVRIAP